MGGKVVVVSHSTIVIEKLHSDTCKHLIPKVIFGHLQTPNAKSYIGTT